MDRRRSARTSSSVRMSAVQLLAPLKEFKLQKRIVSAKGRTFATVLSSSSSSSMSLAGQRLDSGLDSSLAQLSRVSTVASTATTSPQLLEIETDEEQTLATDQYNVPGQCHFANGDRLEQLNRIEEELQAGTYPPLKELDNYYLAQCSLRKNSAKMRLLHSKRARSRVGFGQVHAVHAQFKRKAGDLRMNVLCDVLSRISCLHEEFYRLSLKCLLDSAGNATDSIPHRPAYFLGKTNIYSFKCTQEEIDADMLRMRHIQKPPDLPAACSPPQPPAIIDHTAPNINLKPNTLYDSEGFPILNHLYLTHPDPLNYFTTHNSPGFPHLVQIDLYDDPRRAFGNQWISGLPELTRIPSPGLLHMATSIAEQLRKNSSVS